MKSNAKPKTKSLFPRLLQHSRLLRLNNLIPALVSVLVLNLLGFIAPAAAFTKHTNETEITFKANSGETVQAFKGWLQVPENRSNPTSRLIKLDYVRFPQALSENDESSTEGNKLNAKPPIVYLAGGPGGSGITTAKYARFPLFMAMREFGDVIAFDQRGINENRLPCKSEQTINHASTTTNQQEIETTRAAIKDCLKTWKAQGVDILGYNTEESAKDLDALRQHLKAKKISLWGISYGSHLALAAMKVMPANIDRVVISSVEGLNQTIKMPARTDDYFARLQKAINKKPTLKAKYPNLKQMISSVHTSLEKEPLMLELQKDDQTISFAFQKRTMQSIASAMIADPNSALMLLGLYKSLELGNAEPMTQLLSRRYPIGSHVELSGMSTAMDLASGISASRNEEVLEQAKTSLLGDMLNFGLHHFNDINGIDLGDEFRLDPINDIPTLALSGTLDGRTYIESQSEAIKGLSGATQITVENAGHNLFMSSPEVTATIQQFMRSQPIEKNRIVIELPDN